MRALAGFVMRGREQAVLVAALSTATMLLSWLGAAVVALVTLRKGTRAGLQVLLWALLPAVLITHFMREVGTLAVLLAVMALALLLRSSRSWSGVLVLASLCGALVALILKGVAADYLDQLAERFLQLTGLMVESLGGAAEAAALPAPDAHLLAGMLGLNVAVTALLCLMLARWWQALLYNPGGFRAEFHRLRLPPATALASLALGTALFALGPSWRTWAMMAWLPLVVAGFGLFHGLVGQRAAGRGWLVAGWLLWLLLDPLKLVFLLLAVADSWMDFRGRGPRADNRQS